MQTEDITALVAAAAALVAVVSYFATRASTPSSDEPQEDISSPDWRHLLSSGKSTDACAYCGQQGGSLKKCMRCKQAAYCGAECQKAGWKIHKSNCDPPLWRAARDGLTEKVGQLLQEGADIEGAGGTSLCVPLVVAARGGHSEVVSLLLEKGAEVSGKSSTSATPLHAAVKERHGFVTGLLLEKGADVNARASLGKLGLWTPLQIAAKQGDAAAVLPLPKSLDPHTLHPTPENYPREKVAQLLGAGADIEVQTDQGFAGPG
jgi:putative hemolysin